ncbi:MAG: SMC family ATPase [Candidatus Aenigmarchaeota archaeon]|nr:SMC family ATPase [Candidatus Aenigmarchaeota archaeon]
MFTEIELFNFRSHKRTKLEFSKGNNVFIGISGSGKSSVLDAICFALYGTIPKLQKRKIKISDLIMSKPFTEESAKIILRFEMDNNKYEISREIYISKSSGAELRKNNKLIAINPSQVTEAIEHILKIDYDLFSKVIYAEQNQMDYFLTIPPGNRMNHIDDLLKLSKFESARSKTNSIINKFKNLKSAKSDAIISIKEQELRANKKQVELSLIYLETERLRLEEEIKKTTLLLAKNEIIYKESEKLKSEFKSRKKQFIELEAKISVFRSDLEGEDIGNIFEREKEFENKKSELEAVEKKELERERKISGLESTLKELNNSLTDKKIAQEFIVGFDENDFELLKTKVEEIKEFLVGGMLRKRTLEEAIKNLDKVKGTCPTCDAELNEEKKEKLIKSKKEELSELNKEIINFEKQHSEINTKFKTESKNKEKAIFFINRLKQLENTEEEYERIKNMLAELKANKIDYSKLKEEFLELKVNLGKWKILEIKKQKLKECEEKKTLIEKAIKEVSFNETEFENLRKEVEELKRNLLELKLNYKHKEELKTEKQEMMKQMVREIEFLEKTKAEIEFLEYGSSALSDFSNILVEVQEVLRKEFIETLNEVMNEIWVYVYPYEDYTGIRFKIEDRDYLLQLCDLKNTWINVEGFSSGGERSIASIVLRIALSVVLAPYMKILILDEPTHNLDSNTIDNLTEIFRTKVVDLLDQVIIVTHDERLVQAGTGRLCEFIRGAGKKEPTEIRQLTTN